MKNLKPVDVVISGGGWTGLAMAKEISTRTSLSVMVLERGGPRKLSDYSLSMDELDYAIRMRMMQNIADETITHRHSLKDPAAPIRQYGAFRPGTGTGGTSEHWGGISDRYRDRCAGRPRRSICWISSVEMQSFSPTHRCFHSRLRSFQNTRSLFWGNSLSTS